MLFNKISRQFLRLNAERVMRCNEDANAAKSGKKASNRPLRVSVEGNIGSGKSTLVNYFKQFPTVETYGEPLDKWRNVQGHNLLGLLYDDMVKWNTTFQSYVQLTRVQVQSSAPKAGTEVQMFERSVQNNRYCFLENSYKSGYILPAQYAVLCKWYEWIEENIDITLDLIVYLRSSPRVIYDRVVARNRTEEKTVSMEYLELLHEAHEKWLRDPNLSVPVLVIDADASLSDTIKSYTTILPALEKVRSDSRCCEANDADLSMTGLSTLILLLFGLDVYLFYKVVQAHPYKGGKGNCGK